MPLTPSYYIVLEACTPYISKVIKNNSINIFSFAEEILSSNTALWMSNDGHLVLYASFNDSQVEEQHFPWFGVAQGASLYPEMRSLRYPKPGTANPVARLIVADLADPKNIRTSILKPPAPLADK